MLLMTSQKVKKNKHSCNIIKLKKTYLSKDLAWDFLRDIFYYFFINFLRRSNIISPRCDETKLNKNSKKKKRKYEPQNTTKSILFVVQGKVTESFDKLTVATKAKIIQHKNIFFAIEDRDSNDNTLILCIFRI